MTNSTETETERPSTSQRGAVPRTRTKRTMIVAIVAVVVIAVVATLAWVLLRSRSSTAGRPVPAPRTMSTEQTLTPTTAESTVTVSPDVIQRAGITVEQVGEQLAVETSAMAVTTGTVQANSYRTTPVVSLVGGIVRSVHAELGQGIVRGQTVAVVFSDELAQAQSRYLTAQADLEEHHQHHARTIRLLEIGAASQEELEQATTKLRSAESEVASQRQRLLLLGLSSRRINSLRSSSQVSSEVSLSAPLSGTVVARSANPGEVIQADKEILRVADLSSIWVIGQVFE